jgi:large exoprotein involved in heme utilization and adhesion
MFSYSLSGNGPAGDITIKTSELTLKENALISASSSDSGDSGTIIVDAKNLDISSGSQILTNTKEGIGGNIEFPWQIP